MLPLVMLVLCLIMNIAIVVLGIELPRWGWGSGRVKMY